jgi:hypothetical protein
MAEFIEILSPSALKDLQTANTEVLTLIKNIDNAGKSMQNIKTPSGSDSAVKNLNANLVQQEKLLQKQQRALEKARLEEIKLQQQREKAFDKYEAQLTREQAKLNASTQIYNKVQAKLNALSNEYRNLAVKKELSGKLTDAEAKRYDYLSGRITKYDNTLKAVDASMGKYQRNVGNYASGFNPLSNSINQLTREMPAFTNSVQTGFMALSNNIPIFTDAIGNAIAQNKALQAEGKPTTSVLSQLAGSFFSWQTLMGVGITLLTVYGKEIGEFIKQAFKSSSAIDSIKESQKQLNDINTEGRKNAVEETLNLKSLLAIAKDTNLSYRERKIAVDQLQSTYPAYFGNLKQEQILAGNTAVAERELTDAILSRAKANAAVAKITENQAKIIDFELDKLDLQKQLNKATSDYEIVVKRMQKIQTGKSDVDAFKVLSLADKIQSLKKDILNTDKEIEAQNKINTTLTSFAIEKQKESILLDYKEEKGIKEKTKAKREDVEVLQETSKSYDSLLYKLEKNKSMLEEMQKATSRSSSEWRFYQEAIDKVSRSIDILKNGFPELKESAKAVTDGLELQYKQAEANAKSLADLKKATDEYISSFSSGFLSNAGLGAFDTFFKDIGNGVTEFQQRLESLKQSGADTSQIFALYFESIAESAQQAFNKIIELSNQRFQNELVNLEREKEIAILFAGESASAREEIERQYEARQRDIKNREARAKKGQALFNIAIDIAQGIVSALASGNIPLSIAIGAIGAIQLGLVASQPIPQFATGTDNAPEGFALTQEKGAEIITDKSGKIKTLGNNKGAQMTYLSKGDKVFTAEQSSQLMHNQALNSILTSSGIMPTQILNNSTNVDLTPVVNAINNKESFSMNIDKGGLNTFVTNGHTTKEITNRRIQGQSYGV